MNMLWFYHLLLSEVGHSGATAFTETGKDGEQQVQKQQQGGGDTAPKRRKTPQYPQEIATKSPNTNYTLSIKITPDMSCHHFIAALMFITAISSLFHRHTARFKTKSHTLVCNQNELDVYQNTNFAPYCPHRLNQ